MILIPKTKKGTLADLALMLGVILAIAITVLVANLTWNSYKDELADTIDLSQYPNVERSMNITTDRSMPMLDKIFVAFVIAAYIGTMLLGFRVRTSPIFIMFVFIYMPILVLLAKIMKDVYAELTEASAMVPTVANSTMTFTNQIMNNLPVVTIAFAIGLSIVLYVIRQREAL